MCIYILNHQVNSPYCNIKAVYFRKKQQKDKQRSTSITHKTKARVARTPLNTGGELRCSGRAITLQITFLKIWYSELEKKI